MKQELPEEQLRMVANSKTGVMHSWSGGLRSSCTKFRCGTPQDPEETAVFMKGHCSGMTPCPRCEIHRGGSVSEVESRHCGFRSALVTSLALFFFEAECSFVSLFDYTDRHAGLSWKDIGSRAAWIRRHSTRLYVGEVFVVCPESAYFFSTGFPWCTHSISFTCSAVSCVLSLVNTRTGVGMADKKFAEQHQSHMSVCTAEL